MPSPAASGRPTPTRSRGLERAQPPPRPHPSRYPRTRHHTAEAAMAPKFQGVDFYDVDSLLSEEERAVRDTVRAWVDENLIPIIGAHYIEGRFPKQLVSQMAELGLFGANLPEEYGCAGLNNVAYGLIMQELERGDRSEEHTSELQSRLHLVCRLLLEKKKKKLRR